MGDVATQRRDNRSCKATRPCLQPALTSQTFTQVWPASFSGVPFRIRTAEIHRRKSKKEVHSVIVAIMAELVCLKQSVLISPYIHVALYCTRNTFTNISFWERKSPTTLDFFFFLSDALFSLLEKLLCNLPHDIKHRPQQW